jgi:uncharacterized membrane protein
MANIEWIDLAAFAWFLVLVVGYQWVVRWPKLAARSITGAVQKHRDGWMMAVIGRENRAVDAILLGTLSQGNAFFASTSAIAIGGLAAIIGSGDKADMFLSRLPYVAKSSPLLWELKVLVLIGIFVFAFFKFAWAFRLTHYTAIMIGAFPNRDEMQASEMVRHARSAALVSGLAAEHANSGLRSFYYAAAVMTWFFNPVLFMIASAWVAIILVRRDFFSRSREALASDWYPGR